MTINSAIHALAKAVIPSPIWQRMKEKKALRIRKEFISGHVTRVYDQYFRPSVERIFPVMFASGELHNFTYDLTDGNLAYLAEILSFATGRPWQELTAYIVEAMDDQDLRKAAQTPEQFRCNFGRRLGWYAMVRATKPRIVVETGVERGHGALVLCAALLRNSAEGAPGRYIGTDIAPKAGELLKGKYAQAGGVIVGDSITTLERLDQKINLFINDSDHSADYEYREYQTILDKLTPQAIILGDNAHATDRLIRFSRETGRQFLFFREEPRDHWYPGAGIGISFPLRTDLPEPDMRSN